MTGQGEWRIDPTGRHQWRYWDGERYTEWVADDGAQETDSGPLPQAPPAWSQTPLAAVESDVIEVGFGSPGRQNRWKVGFRLLLAIPHFLWSGLVGIAAMFVVIAGWFAALFTGRLPAGIARFLSRVLQYFTRLNAYVWLLLDDYPKFRLSDDTYPVVVETRPGKLNRWAVLFRLVLAVPAQIVTNVASGGLTVCGVFLWIIVLAKGRMPRTGAEAVAAVIRYQTRFYGYLMMLTGTYPGGLFGDADPNVTTPWLEPTKEPSVPAMPPRTARLVLSRGGKRLVVLFVVLGSLLWVANSVLNARLDTEARGDTSVRIDR